MIMHHYFLRKTTERKPVSCQGLLSLSANE